jgi:hypothetical protein
MSYTCRNCGATSENAHALCSAARGTPEAPFCGIPEEWICEKNLDIMKYSCRTCGSFSAQPEHLCKPVKLEVTRTL